MKLYKFRTLTKFVAGDYDEEAFLKFVWFTLITEQKSYKKEPFLSNLQQFFLNKNKNEIYFILGKNDASVLVPEPRFHKMQQDTHQYLRIGYNKCQIPAGLNL